MLDRYHQVPVTIANGETASAAGVILGYQVVGVVTPASWDGANITFQIDPDGAATFYAVEDDGNAAVQVDDPGASKVGLVPSDAYVLIGHSIKVVASSGVGAARIVILICRAI